MNILIYHSFEVGHHLEEKTKVFIKNKGNSKFLLCEYIQKENLPKWIKRQEEILMKFNAKVSGEESDEDFVYLFKQDKIALNRLILMYENSKDKEKFKVDMNKIFSMIKVKVMIFIEKLIDEIVTPINEIDHQLKSHLMNFLSIGSSRKSDSDAKTIASAIQEHNKNSLKIITADKKDWTKELLGEVHYHIELEKKYPELPEITYLQNI